MSKMAVSEGSEGSEDFARCWRSKTLIRKAGNVRVGGRTRVRKDVGTGQDARG